MTGHISCGAEVLHPGVLAARLGTAFWILAVGSPKTEAEMKSGTPAVYQGLHLSENRGPMPGPAEHITLYGSDKPGWNMVLTPKNHICPFLCHSIPGSGRWFPSCMPSIPFLMKGCHAGPDGVTPQGEPEGECLYKSECEDLPNLPEGLGTLS